MRRLSSSPLLAPLVVVLALVLAAAHPARAIQHECSACKAVARELYHRLLDEGDVDGRPAVDLRHRLDPRGNRVGKVVPYVQSELRAYDVLDGLCDGMKDYGVGVLASTREEGWVKLQGDRRQTVHINLGGGGDGGDSLSDMLGGNFAQAKVEADGKRLTGYCGSVVDEREEVVVRALMDGTMRVGTTKAAAAAGDDADDAADDDDDDADADDDPSFVDIVRTLCVWETRRKKSPCPVEEELGAKGEGEL